MRLASALVIVATLVGSAHADGDGLTDMLGPREIALGEALRGGATDASTIAMNPADLPLSRDLVFEGGYGYRLSDDASLVGVSACDTTGNLPGCFYYDYAGANPELDGASTHTATHVGGVDLGYAITPHVYVGSGVKYYHYDDGVMGQPSSSGFTWDFGATLRLTQMVNLGVVGQNLLGATSEDFPRTVGGGLYVHPVPSLALSFDTRWKLDGMAQGARYGGGAEYFLGSSDGQSGFPIRLGGLHDNGLGTTYLSAGLGYVSMQYGIDIGARHAIDGSDETLILASLRFFGKRFPGPTVDPTPQ
ncbi:MAG TPA: hypothetical protein VLX92_33110 [Kofleriaceae bacterium]|nr:hypothetical protein [Kofleriaceae bacterium]